MQKNYVFVFFRLILSYVTDDKHTECVPLRRQPKGQKGTCMQ